jgi:hypothetical protein
MANAELFGGIKLMDFIPLIAMAVVEEAPNHSNSPTTSRDGVLSGSDYLNELLNCGNKKRIYRVLRIKKETFLRLSNLFRKQGLLKDSRYTSIEQQVA